jgi:hypothetical protein
MVRVSIALAPGALVAVAVVPAGTINPVLELAG